MAESDSSSILGFTKLNSFNYSSWKINMKVLLIDKGSWEFVGGTEKPLPTDATDRDLRSYEMRKARSYSTIFQGIDEQFQPLIADTEDGKTAWTILKENFEPTSRARLAGLIDEFFELKFDPEKETIGIFCKLVNEKRKQIHDAGFEMPEKLTCFQLIRRLPADYDNLVQMLYRLEDKDFSISNVEKELLIESGRIQQKQKDRGEDIVADAYTTSSTRKQAYRKLNGNKSSGRVLGNDTTTTIMCSYCNKKGHSAERCFLKKKTTKRNSKTQDSKETFYSDLTTIRDAEIRQRKDKQFVEFLIDTASTAHFCTQRDYFSNFKTLNPSQVLVGDKNSKSDIFGIGDIHFNVKDRDKFVPIKLENVYFAPNMRRNLISGSNMDLAGITVKWGNNKMTVFGKNHNYLFTVPRIDKLYILKGYVEKVVVTKELAFSTGLDRELVHRRFCHLNIGMLNHMSQNNVVNGLDNLCGKFDTCNTCKITKSTRTSFKVNHGIMTKSVLEKVHMDVWGIRMERTSVYTPEQNGVAESYNRVAGEGIRSMLADSGLKGRFWAEALHCFVHVKNRSEHKLLEGKTPFEIFYGYKPSVKHFKVFGSLAYAHIPKVQRNKLQPNAKVGIVTGYAVNTKGYRIYLPKDRKTIETIHVKIDESKNGVKTLFGKPSNENFLFINLNSDINFDNNGNEIDKVHAKSPDLKLKPLKITEWTRVERPRNKSSRIDVYYYPPSDKTRLRSNNQAKEYCDKNQIDDTDSESEDSPSNSFVDNQISDIFEGEEIVDKPPNAEVIGNRWVYAVKRDENNNVKQYKARLVAQGFRQQHGVDFLDVFSPVVNFSVIRLLFIILVSMLCWKYAQLDVKAAYLYGNLSEVIYMKQPPGFEIEGEMSKILRSQYSEQSPLAVIIAIIFLGIESNRDWKAWAGTAFYAASTLCHNSSTVVTEEW
nr:uncharacterized protein LOC110282258 [Parasteatoda tepidariorum]